MIRSDLTSLSLTWVWHFGVLSTIPATCSLRISALASSVGHPPTPKHKRSVEEQNVNSKFVFFRSKIYLPQLPCILLGYNILILCFKKKIKELLNKKSETWFLPQLSRLQQKPKWRREWGPASRSNRSSCQADTKPYGSISGKHHGRAPSRIDSNGKNVRAKHTTMLPTSRHRQWIF
jgi:hypothetical protein